MEWTVTIIRCQHLGCEKMATHHHLFDPGYAHEFALCDEHATELGRDVARAIIDD